MTGVARLLVVFLEIINFVLIDWDLLKLNWKSELMKARNFLHFLKIIKFKPYCNLIIGYSNFPDFVLQIKM